MSDVSLDHFLAFSQYTDPGLYKILFNSLPEKISDIGLIVRKQLIHRTTLRDGNIGTNSDQKYGDMTRVPWWRQCEEDIFITASAILNELYRRDTKGLYLDRPAEAKLILTCRHLCVLMASILKSKGIPCRVRSGFAPYFTDFTNSGKSYDHWINEYWLESEKRWVTIDVDGFLHNLSFDPYDIPLGKFDFAADAYLQIRQGKIAEQHFQNGGGTGGLKAVLWELFYDLHCLMNNEVIYLQVPAYIWGDGYDRVTEKDFQEIDSLARLMQDPDSNFEELLSIWENNKKFRLLKGGVL